MVCSPAHFAAVSLAFLTVTAGCSAVTDVGGPPDAFETTGLDSFQTYEPTCGDARSSNASAYSRPAPGGRKLSLNTTVPVRSPATELTADFETLGEHRYRLAIQREGGIGVPDCYLEVRYNATMNLTDAVADRYTILVTYDDVLVGVHYADPDSAGSVRGLAPETRYAPWAKNVSDANGGLARNAST
jgi:hypothetical protein